MKNLPLIYDREGPGFLRVEDVKYHRNGVGGPGFYAVAFSYDGTDFTGVVDADNGLVYVTDNGDVRNTMRGHDFFGDALVRAVNLYERREARKRGWSAGKPLVKGRI